MHHYFFSLKKSWRKKISFKKFGLFFSKMQ